MKANEIIADILREMRADSIETEDGVVTFDDYADRIEAAAKRERVEIRRDAEIEWTHIGYEERKAEEKSAPGNAALMRAALERLNRIAFGVLEFPLDGDSSEIYEANKKKVELPAWCIAELLNAAKGAQDAAHVALAAPARNCDRFQTAKDALDAFIREKEIKEEDVDNMNLRDFFDWLFNTAEGGAK